MTLYTQTESNIRKTWILLICFLILILFLGWLFSYLFNTRLFLILAIAIAFFQSFLSFWYSDKIILAMTHAKEIKKEDNPELYRLVENLCITAGLPLPKVYIIEDDQPNAFATGRNSKHAVVAVTRGLLKRLERVELEGVIAHELSHIGNKDMFLQTMVVILAGAIVLLSSFFLRISFWQGGGRSRGKEGGGAVFLILGVLAAILAPLVANLIKLAISRKREFLADATAVLLTRHPEGLARALEKISQSPNSLKGANNSNAHLFIVSPFRGKSGTNWLTKLFSTHPPVEERIKVLRQTLV